MLAIQPEQLQELKTLLAANAPGLGVLAFGSRVLAEGQSQRVKPFSDLDLALTGQALQPQDLFALREAMSESNLPFRVDICYWDDLPARWRQTLKTELLQ